nr:hypothetical protein [Planococcus glaciei]
MLRFDDIDFSDSFYAIQKTGHFLSFALLYVLVLNWLKKRETALRATVAFALLPKFCNCFSNGTAAYLMRESMSWEFFWHTGFAEWPLQARRP